MSYESTETGHLEAAGGVRLFYRWQSPAEPRGTVVIVHGFAEHSGRYQHVAAFLAERGYASLAFDSRGHGDSGGRRGYVDAYGQYADDVEAAVAEARERSEGRPMALLGHSQGGLVATWYALDREPDLATLILSGPFFELGFKPPAWKDVLGAIMSKIWPTLSIPAGIDPASISRDQAVVDAYVADPKVFTQATARWYTESLGAQKRCLAEAGDISMPTLVMHGEADRLVSPNGSARFYAALGAADKDHRTYPGLFHEILNEPEQEQILGEIADWLDQRMSG